MYLYGARIVHLKNDVYEKLIRYLDVWQVYNMCIWRHHNTTMTLPDDDMICMFNLPAKEMEEEAEQLKKMTQMTINENYTLRRAKWSVTQRLAAQHTRDFFLYGFEMKKPMLCDLKCTQDNHDMIREFILALLKAEVGIETIRDICDAQLFGMPEVPKMVVEEMSKKKMEMPVQRSSITDFSPIATEVVAATKLQRAYRKRLETLKDAVRRIEVWWEPFRVENIEIRLEIAQEMEETINNLQHDLENVDLFQYKELVTDIKDDYKTVRRPETRTNKYWLKVILILTVPVAIGILLESWNGWDNRPLLLVCYGAFQLLTLYRKLWKVLWFQTLVLWLFTVILLNREVSLIQDGWIRIPVWVVIVGVGRKRWILLFLATLVIRIGLTLFSDTFSIQPTEYGLVVYDLYCMATIAGASRQGTPIEMLHKVVINVVFLIIIAFSGAVGCLYGYMIINN